MTTHTVGANRGDMVPSAILGLLGTRGPSSRADIARTLNVSPATVTQTTKELIARSLVEELDSVPSQGGRPARLLGLVRSAGGAIGAKVTADHVAIVDVQLDGTVQTSTSQPFDPTSPDALDRLCRILGSAVEAHEGQLLGVGVGIPGSVDSQGSGVVDAPTLGWSDAQVGPMLRAALGVPVLVDNDVNTLAAAERIYGVGRHHSPTWSSPSVAASAAASSSTATSIAERTVARARSATSRCPTTDLTARAVLGAVWKPSSATSPW